MRRSQHVLSSLLFICAISACSTQEYGQCVVQDDTLKIMFKPKSKVNVFSHSFCIVCNPTLTPDEYGDWALDMGAPQAPSSTDGLLPCLYAYSEAESFEECAASICDGTAAYNDMVSEQNGNFNLEPLFDSGNEFPTITPGN